MRIERSYEGQIISKKGEVMRRILLTSAFVLLAVVTKAESGKCIANGRVGGEDTVCARYSNTNEESCKKADGWAWCSWEKSESPRGTGPIFVECRLQDGEVKKYRVNSLHYNGNKSMKLVAIGFGPNRQDDGFAEMKGDCSISIIKN